MHKEVCGHFSVEEKRETKTRQEDRLPTRTPSQRPGPRGSGASCPVLGGKGYRSQNRVPEILSVGYNEPGTPPNPKPTVWTPFRAKAGGLQASPQDEQLSKHDQ